MEPDRDCIIILTWEPNQIEILRCRESKLNAIRKRYDPHVAWFGLLEDFWRMLGKALLERSER